MTADVVTEGSNRAVAAPFPPDGSKPVASFRGAGCTSDDARAPATTAAKPWVAELYDSYVTTEVDIPFFLTEAMRADGPVLELMAGTGRVSLPLAEAGISLTCVDISGPMLDRLRSKLAAKGLQARTVEADVSRLALPDRDYALALLPFQSFAELPEPRHQRATLANVAAHLRPGGRFVLTLHNPHLRQRTIDGRLRPIGTFPLSHRDGTLMLWCLEERLQDTPVVRSTQLYELYDADGLLEETRRLEVRYRLVERREFEALAEAAGFRIVSLYGDYDRSPFRESDSPFMIWRLQR